MINDPIIQEIRRIRLELEAESQNNPQVLYDYLCQVQEKYRDRLIRRSPKPAIIPSASSRDRMNRLWKI